VGGGLVLTGGLCVFVWPRHYGLGGRMSVIAWVRHGDEWCLGLLWMMCMHTYLCGKVYISKKS
jgi:hypothetical protein